MAYDIEFNSVTFQYADSTTPALRDIDLHIAPGEVVLVTGPAGSGKTTLCSCINGLIPHYHEGDLAGDVVVRGYNTRRTRIGGLASLVGMVFQDPESQLVTASVVDEVAFGPENLGVARDEINRRVVEALGATRLTGYEEREPYSLSGGEQQACVIAAIYAMHPDIYVMDEPTANLDPLGKAQVLELVVRVAKQRGKTLVIVEHALEEVLPLVDRMLVMDGGRIVRQGPVAQVLAEGDLPNVFVRPPIVRIADSIGLNPLPLTPDEFYEKLTSRYRLKSVQIDSPALPPAAPPQPAIEIRDLSFSYDGERAALDGVSLTIGQGELVALMGRNGSGKTTLARHLIGLIEPEPGKVVVLGKDVSETPTHELAKDVGYCFQNPNHQIVSLNVRDEMIFGLRAHQVDPNEWEERVTSALEFVGLRDALETDIFSLGKGQKQRLALASVLTLNPSILIVDEPTTGQDPQMTREIFEIIKRLNEQGTIVLMITHSFEQAASYARRVVVLDRGRVAHDGSFQDLMADRALMQANSLDVPHVTKLAERLSAYGVSPRLVRAEQLEKAIHLLVEASNGN